MTAPAADCVACAQPVPAAARFCPHCGMAQPQPCPHCGAVNAGHHRFCADCGQALRAAAPATAPATPPAAAAALAPAPRADHAERRQITVLFCDLADSTAMASTTDPEDFREVVQAYHQATVQVVQAYGGHVAQYLGDGLLAYFGWPRALEDAAARALHAARGIVGALPALNDRLQLLDARRLRVRVGVHTGLVVVGDVGAGARLEQLAIGDVPNVAARLQAAAQPDSVVASATTRSLVREPMPWRDLGTLQLKGVAQPLRAYALDGGSVDAAERSAVELPPIVGRESESAFIDGAWASARAGAGTVVLVSGEPGIGKSRLLAYARQRAIADGGRAIVLRCSPYHTASELHPLIEWMEQAMGFVPTDSGAERCLRLAAAVAASNGNGAAQELALLAALMSVPLPEGSEPLRLTPQVARQRTRSVLLRWLLAQAVPQPLLLAFEDLHWADPSTLDFIQELTGALVGAHVVLLATFRPEFSPPWPAAPRTVRLGLERLSQDGIEAIVRRLAGGRPLPDAVLRRIVANTDGVPLFVEEFTRTVLESGALEDADGRWTLRGDLLVGLIPESLRDSLAARLDRLGDGRAVARHASVIGRRFEASLVAALSGLSLAQVQAGLAELTRAGLVYPVDLHSSSERYEFKHALVQVAAYESLLRRERAALHTRVAHEIETRLPDLADRQPELLAYHLTESQQWAPAAQRWLLAGQRALVRSANAEAIAHLRAGLALVPQLPEPAREGLELALLSTIGPALIATTGFGSQQVGEVYRRARQLCEQLHDRPEFFPSLWGSWVFHLVSGPLAAARQIAEQMLEQGQRRNDPAMLVEAHWTLGNALFWLGELPAADEQLSLTPAVYDPDAHAAHALLYGQDPLVAAECYRSYSQWALGHVDQALAAVERAAAAAARRDHIFTTGWVLAFRFMVHLFRREPALALEAAERTLSFSSEHNHAFWTAAAQVVRGWAHAQLSDHDQGVAQLREGLALYDQTGSNVVQALWYALLADLELAAGRLAQAAQALDAGMAKAQQVGERLSEIELWRLRGRWHAAQQPPQRDDARRCLEHALAMAGACSARIYALRAATDWHRLMRLDAQALAGSPLPALLAQLHEGHDIRDHIEARATLAGDPA